LLNQYFIPVYARNGDYQVGNEDRARGNLDKGGAAPAAEKAEYYRIYHEAVKAGLSTGTVHVYIVDPAGHPIDSLHVAEATKPDRLLAMLQRSIEKLKLAPGKPLIKPCVQSKSPPPGDADALVLHLTARYLARQGDDYVRLQPVLGTERSSQWASLPSEDWVLLTRAEWTALLPAGKVRAVTSWDWDRKVAAKLLTHFYPPTENTDVAKNRIDEQTLTATVVSITDGVVRARIEGRLRMKHPFYHRDTDEFVEATLVGFMDFDVGQPAIRSLFLVTDQATYGGKPDARHPFGVAVRSLP
jgi:hypothetical protein